VYPVLKRPDERYVTMQAYDNPVFVEDIARGVAQQLERDQRVNWFRVQAENHESIHSHNVFADVEWTRPNSSASSSRNP
jgi:GTP cyclohydrolase I